MTDVAGPILFDREDYPITIRLLRSDNFRVVWERKIDLEDIDPKSGLGGVYVPAMAQREGVLMIAEVETAEGGITRAYPGE